MGPTSAKVVVTVENASDRLAERLLNSLSEPSELILAGLTFDVLVSRIDAHDGAFGPSIEITGYVTERKG